MHTDLRLRCIEALPTKNSPPFSFCTRCLLQLSYFEVFLIYHTYICKPSSQGSSGELFLKIFSKGAFEDETEKVVLIFQLGVSSISIYGCRSFKRHRDKLVNIISTLWEGRCDPGWKQLRKLRGQGMARGRISSVTEGPSDMV